MLTLSGYEGPVYRSEADEAGHESQKLLCKVMANKLEIPEVDRGAVGQELKHFAFAEATEEEEDGKGIDFWFYNAQSERWVPMDFTTSNNHVDLREKEERMKKLGGVVLKIPARTLKLAARGAERDIKAVAREIATTFGIRSEK